MVLGCIHFFNLCNIQEVMNFHTQQGVSVRYRR